MINWIETKKTYVVDDHPSQVIGLFFNDTDPNCPVPDVWHKKSLKGVVPDDTKAVLLAGILLITHGSAQEIANLRLGFRKTGSTSSDFAMLNYIMQCIEVTPEGGQRSTCSAVVPLDDALCFDWQWKKTNSGTYPEYSSHGVNLKIQACFAK